MRKLTLAAALGATIIVSACAQSPSSIAPVSMGDAYSGVDCTKVRNDIIAERERLAALSAKQQGAVVGDAVGVFLIGVPVSSLTGNDQEGHIATSKGKINAMEARLLRCA